MNTLPQRISYIWSLNTVKYKNEFNLSFLKIKNIIKQKGGDLEEYLENYQLNRSEILEWFYQIILVVQYLHNNDPPCIHRNLKPL